MDYLPLDHQGLVPSIDLKQINGDLWIGLNTPCDAIPLEASSPTRIPVFKAMGPTGMYFEMEWALDADWYDPDAGWRPYLPKPTQESNQWYFQLDHNTPVDLQRASESGEYSIHSSILTKMEHDLRRFEACVVAIAHSTTFPMRGCRPGRYDYEPLHGIFCDTQALEDFGANVKRQALDYLGFINWWTSSVSFWDNEIPQMTIDTIIDLDLPAYPRRGVLIDLQKDWRQISIPHLLKQRVPIYIRWNKALDHEERFTSISPRILRAFAEKRHVAMDGKVFSYHMPDYAADFDIMKGYDEFFQDRVFDGSIAEGIEFSDDIHFGVVDFQGWMYRPIPLRTAKEFVTQFGSHIVRYNNRTSVIFCRWEALDDQASISPPAGMPQDGTDDELVRGHLEMREIH